jgi:hypothetical protein
MVTVLFTFAGFLLGAYLIILEQHHKWLLERRSEAFAKFLDLIENARNRASDILIDTELQKRQNHTKRDIKVLEVYQPVLIQARVIRLYLPQAVRDEFFNLVKDYWALHTDPDLGDSRHRKMGQNLEAIQEIFEHALSLHFWIRPVYECFSRIKSNLTK